jgi:hypothetical protein
MLDFIAPQHLKDMVDSNAMLRATVIADQDVFKITVEHGTEKRVVSVRTRDGQNKERVFPSLNAVARFMREKVHITRYEVNTENFQLGTKQLKRPDTSQRLKEAHAALSHNDWLQQKVNASRNGLANGNNKLIAADEWESIRSSKRAQRDAL